MRINREKYSLENMAKELLIIIDKNVSHETALKLPKLKKIKKSSDLRNKLPKLKKI